MANLLIRDVDDAVYEGLEHQARVNGRTVEQEGLEALRRGVVTPAPTPAGENIVQIAARFFGPDNGVDLDLPPRSADIDRPPPDFSGSEYDR